MILNWVVKVWDSFRLISQCSSPSSSCCDHWSTVVLHWSWISTGCEYICEPRCSVGSCSHTQWVLSHLPCCSLWSAEVQESHLQWGAEIKQHCVHCCVFFCSLVSVIGQCHTCGYLWFCKYNSCKLLDRLYITFVQSDLSTGRHSDADLVDCGRDKAQCWSLQRGCILDIYFNLPYQHTNPGQFCAIRHFFKFWVQ